MRAMCHVSLRQCSGQLCFPLITWKMSTHVLMLLCVLALLHGKLCRLFPKRNCSFSDLLSAGYSAYECKSLVLPKAFLPSFSLFHRSITSESIGPTPRRPSQRCGFPIAPFLPHPTQSTECSLDCDRSPCWCSFWHRWSRSLRPSAQADLMGKRDAATVRLCLSTPLNPLMTIVTQ